MKILFVATVVQNHIIEFHVPYLKMLKEEMGWNTAVAARNDYALPTDCTIPYCDTYYDIPFERNPFTIGNIKAFKQLKRVIDEGNYDIIHCHTPVGAMLTRLAALDARKRGTKVFYTAHGFHFYKGAPLINWILYYWAEKLLAMMTDVLITITHEDYKRAKGFKAGKVEYVPGVGIDMNYFKKGSQRQSTALRAELGIPNDATVLLSVGEVNANKNHKVVIEALPEFSNTWYVICGRGPLIEKYRILSQSLGVGDRVIMTGYRTNVEDYYNMADIFVFPSIREGLPVALMEAMAMELVCVAAKNRGTDDLLGDSQLRFEPTSVTALKDKLNKVILGGFSTASEIERNKERLQAFDIRNTLQAIKSLYLREANNH